MDVVDILIIGAGVSGISAAVHVKTRCPDKSFTLLEARDQIGGTWDLFRYPGIRSDSDMHTFGFAFKPWLADKAIADGPSILAYLKDTVRDYGLEGHIHYGAKIVKANWDGKKALWTVTSQDGRHFSARLLYIAAGYYSYDQPYNPALPGEADFLGPIIHPQLWDERLDYKDKRIIIIGSGATAVTLLPVLAQSAAHVTMLQRSPTYMIARPQKDWIANSLRKILPARLAYGLTRRKNIWLQNYVYKKARRQPEKAKAFLMDAARKALGDDFPVDTHFNPAYYPWEQRLCLMPDGDLYQALKGPNASIVTGQIKSVTKSGVRLNNGDELAADVIIKATGLNVTILSDIALSLDHKPLTLAEHFTYEAVMYSDIPNLVSVFGYVNASWTLRADLIARFACRLLDHMSMTNTQIVTPRAPAGMKGQPWITIFNPGYINRVLDKMPRQGDHPPWLNRQDYQQDRYVFLKKPLEGDGLEFSKAAQQAPQKAAGLD